MYIYVSNVSQLIKPRAVQLVIGDEILQCPHNNVVLYSTSASYNFQRSYYLSISVQHISVNSPFIYMICQVKINPRTHSSTLCMYFVITIIINQLFCTHRN